MPGQLLKDAPWWKEGVVYQVYPASYNDSNNDGMGDLEGIIQKLDYIRSIGVDIVWICPHFDSPQIDMGYDISDYQDIYRPYGTVADCERLIEECHKRDMKIIFDLVVNHTSDQHKWFQESRSSKENPKRDWYIWRPAKYDADGNRKPPNNWKGNFSTPAWTWDEHTQEYYLHLFASEQPDLNWENDDVRKTIWEDVCKFWLDKGVNGFRVDTVNMYSKGEMKDAPITDPDEEAQFAGMQYCNGPRMHEFMRDMYNVMDKYDAMTVGELPNTPSLDKVKEYVSAKQKQLNMVFQFDVVDVFRHHFKGEDDQRPRLPLVDFRKAVDRTQNILNDSDAWTTAFLENHDQARSVSRFASDAPEYREASARLLALMLVTLSGTLFIYQGQEIGMINVPESWSIDEYKDLSSQNWYNSVKKAKNGDEQALAGTKRTLQFLARDHARVPMQWDATSHGGFSETTPWMRANDDYRNCNVAAQEKSKTSVLSFWKEMIQLRKDNPELLTFGEFEDLAPQDEDVFMYSKTFDGKKAVVVLNFTPETRKIELPSKFSGGRLLSGTEQDHEGEYKAFEGRVYVL